MDGANLVVVSRLAFQGLCALLGFGVVVMGFALFLKGVFNPCDMTVVWKDSKLLIKRAAPGTVFVLAGCVVMWGAMTRKLSFDEHGPRFETAIHLSRPPESPKAEPDPTGIPPLAPTEPSPR